MMPQRKKTRIVIAFLSVIFLFSFLISNQLTITNNANILKVDQSELPKLVSPDYIHLKETLKLSSTGLNSTHTRVLFNPATQRIGVSWVDLFQPDTPAAISALKFAIGNETTSWGLTVDVVSVSDTMHMGYNPTPDMNGTIHFIFDEFSVDNFDINDVPIENEVTVQTKENIVSNSGNSTCPVTIFDSNGLVHLVWIDTTDNPDHAR